MSLGSNIVDAIDALSEADKKDMAKVWEAVGGEIAGWEVTASDVSIADAGERYDPAEDVEEALQEIAGAGRTTETVKGNADGIAAHDHDTEYLGITAKAADSDKLDNHDSTYFSIVGHNHDAAYLGITAQAVDSDKLDGSHAAAFSLSGHNHDGVYLGVAAKAADSELLDNHDSTYFSVGGHLHNDTYYTETEINNLLAGYFKLNENETVAGRPSFNGGVSGSTPPFYVDSTYKVANLNADLLDGYHAAIAATINTIVQRNSSGRAQIATPSVAADIATKGYADAVQTNLNTHINIQTIGVHGSMDSAAAGKLVHRDGSGRAKMAPPSVATDIAIKDTIDTHANIQTAGVHGSTVAATANKAVHRDAAGRAKVAAPSVAADIARKDTVDIHAALAAAGIHGSAVAAIANKLIHRNASSRAQIATPSAAADIANKSYVDSVAGGGLAVKIGFAIRNTSGAQVISGVGFQPSVVLFFALDTVTGDHNRSWGFDDGSSHMSIRLEQDGTVHDMNTGVSVYVKLDSGNYIYSWITALGGDGFTITWTVVGNRGCKFVYLALA